MSEADAKAAGLLVYFGKEIDDAYMEALKKQIIHPDVIKEMADDLTIVYTPFHGAGLVPVTRVLSELGFKKVRIRISQHSRTRIRRIRRHSSLP